MNHIIAPMPTGQARKARGVRLDVMEAISTADSSLASYDVV